MKQSSNIGDALQVAGWNSIDGLYVIEYEVTDRQGDKVMLKETRKLQRGTDGQFVAVPGSGTFESGPLKDVESSLDDQVNRLEGEARLLLKAFHDGLN